MRFDHLMAKAEKLHALCVRHLNNIAEHMRHARRAAYRFAQTTMLIEAEYHNEFLDFVMVQKLDIDAWYEEKYAPIEQVFNQDRRVLCNNIRAGMTEKEYIRHGDLWTLRKERVYANHVQADAEVTTPPVSMTPIEAAAYWKARADALITEVRDLRTKVRTLCAQLQLAERRLANLTKVFKTGSAAKKAQ
ncbi:MAG: hypothetical protein V1790_11375 [Planctomycetota bacterium]